MATVPKTRCGLHWRQKTKPAKRDPVAERFHRDRLTALVVVRIMAVIFAAVITLATLNSGPIGSEIIGPWMIPQTGTAVVIEHSEYHPRLVKR